MDLKEWKEKMRYITESDFSVTYKLNKVSGIFNWYPYTEGFSKPFVDKMLSYFKAKPGQVILDPFSGCGTTALASSLQGIDSLSIEVNPFMNFIGENKCKALSLDPNLLKKDLENLLLGIIIPKNTNEMPAFIRGRGFFEESNLDQAIAIKSAILELNLPEDRKNFFLLHLSSILVRISNMIRAVDLRYRKEKPGKIDVTKVFKEKVEDAIRDIKSLPPIKSSNSTFINLDICNLGNKVDKFLGKSNYFITSPPYLNGTNYDRNTKLEMGFLDLIKNDADLKELRTQMVTAGINSTHTRNQSSEKIDFLQELISEVEKKAYDRRIPIMIKNYFNDMLLALQNINKLLTDRAKGVIVIGDSQFGGVHIETDLILAKLCKIVGFKVDSIDVVRKRRSKNGMELRESLIFVSK